MMKPDIVTTMKVTTKKEKVRMTIFETKEYSVLDAEGIDQEIRIIERISLDDPTIITRHAIVGIPIDAGRSIPLPISFPAQYTLKECFENFKSEAEKAFGEFKKEAEEANRIIAPNNKGGIIIP